MAVILNYELNKSHRSMSNVFIEFLTLKNMGVDTEISFLSALDAKL